MVWTGRIISGLVVLFTLVDSITKLMKLQQVIDATPRIGFPVSTIVGVSLALLVGTILYSIPQTAALEAILLNAHLGGAVAANVRAQSPTFNTISAITFGMLVWLGLFLREPRLCALLPLCTRYT